MNFFVNLSIIIVNWNTRDLLVQCLASVYGNPPIGEFQVIVVDNGSTDGSVAMVSERFPQIQLVANDKNVGFVRGNNQAMPLSRGRHVLLLNSDTIVQANALSRMVEFMDAHPDAGIVGSYVLNPDGTPQACFWKFPTLVSETAYAFGLDSRQPFSTWFGPQLGFEKEYLQIDWVLGASLLIRRAALDQAGLLDEQFFMYSEEVDLCYRVAQAGWKNYVLGTARITHFGGQSSRQMPAPMKAELFHNKIKYFRKHKGPPMAWAMCAIFSASILSRMWMYRLRGCTQMFDLWSEAWEYFTSRKQYAMPTNR